MVLGVVEILDSYFGRMILKTWAAWASMWGWCKQDGRLGKPHILSSAELILQSLLEFLQSLLHLKLLSISSMGLWRCYSKWLFISLNVLYSNQTFYLPFVHISTNLIFPVLYSSAYQTACMQCIRKGATCPLISLWCQMMGKLILNSSAHQIKYFC